MSYVDGFVAAVPTANRAVYKKHAEDAAVVFKEHGALKMVECWGDDVPEGKLTSFPMAVKRKDNETVVFGAIVMANSKTVWPSLVGRHTCSSYESGRDAGGGAKTKTMWLIAAGKSLLG